jgi:hypothetical protein
MANPKFDKEITAVVLIDPYNDFISEGGKVWDRLKTVAEANGCIPHMLQVLNAARKPRCCSSTLLKRTLEVPIGMESSDPVMIGWEK